MLRPLFAINYTKIFEKAPLENAGPRPADHFVKALTTEVSVPKGAVPNQFMKPKYKPRMKPPARKE